MGELFVSRRDHSGHFDASGCKTKKEFLDEIVCNSKIFGFDVKYNNLDKELIDAIKGTSIIHLIRNSGRTALRHINKKDKNSLNYHELMKHRAWVEANIDDVRNKFKDNYLEITYEEMTLGREITELPKAFEEKLLAFLHVPYKRLSMIDKSLKIRY